MANEQSVTINFAQGLDTKTDEWQVPVGKFLSLENSVFQKGGLLSKRPGYGELTATTPATSYLTTFNGNLVSIGTTVNAFSENTETWITKGQLQPCSLGVIPLLRNNLNQVQCDSAISNGFACSVYIQDNATITGSTASYYYVIADAVTGQNIVTPTLIPALPTGTINGSSRVFVVGPYFVIVSQVLVGGTQYLQYFSISAYNPLIVSGPQNTSSDAYVPATPNPGWDATVSNETLILAYNTTSGGQGIHVLTLTQAQISANVASTVIHSFTNAAYIGAVMTVCADLTASPNIIYISFWNNSTSNGYTCAVYVTYGFSTVITTQFNPVQVITAQAVANLASAAQNGAARIYFEINHAYSYDSKVPTNYVNGVTISQFGAVGTTYESIRSVGLASKAFVIGGTEYYLAAFQSPFQPSYFLINGTLSTSANPVIVAKLAYQNGGGYLTLGLPAVTVTGSTAQIAYLFKDDVEAINTANNTQQTPGGGIYSQLGINLVSINIGTQNIDTIELGNNLNLSGGYLGAFDGFLPVEQNFFVFPDSIELVYNPTSTVTPTGNLTSGSAVVTSVSSTVDVYVGQSITGTAIPANTFVLYVTGSTITMTQAATSNETAETLTIQGNIAAVPAGASVAGTGLYYYQVTYEWTDMQGNAFKSQPSIPVTYTTSGSAATGIVQINGPMLRLTQKVSTPVKIVIYRWSEATQVYNQITSFTQPLLNDTTVDQFAYIDALNDSSVVGNNILYTTGGVVPDTNGPASNIMTAFDTRLFQVDAEDQNLLWVSKTVVEGAPVEMSSEFTIYVAPNTGTIQSSGPITALAPMDSYLIIFKKDEILYINGTGPDNLGTTSPGCPLGNYSPATFVTSVVGCTNQQSIVLTQDGLMFQSDKGIWLLGRNLQTSYIGAPVEQFNSSTVTSANVVPGTNYVLFTLNTGQMLMYDYYYGQWGTFVGVPATSSCIYKSLHTVIDTSGAVLQQTPSLYLDNANPVQMQFTTSWINLAGIQGYERFYEFYFLGRYLSPHLLTAQLAYDYNDSAFHVSTIKPQNFSTAVPGPFGISTPFGAMTQLENWRIHAKQQLCSSFQITFSEIYDPTMGVPPGAGLTISGLTLKVGIKKALRPIKGSNSVG